MADKVDFDPRLGADPELFVIAKKGTQYNKNTIVPVCGLVGGTKDNPIPVPNEAVKGHVYLRDSMPNGFAYQEDNVMFEFNIPPAATAEIFSNHIQGYLKYLDQNVIGPRGLMFSWNNKHKFNEKMLQHPSAQTIGCSPDFSAYMPQRDNMRRPFDITQLGTSRFCGGHLHVQYNYNNVPREVFARLMDLAVSLPYLKLDKQTERRQFYGKAGIYRPKSYGIEYRTPSNFWLEPNFQASGSVERLASNVFALARFCGSNPEEMATFYSNKVPWPDVEKSINEEDTKLGEEVTRYILNFAPFNIYHAYSSDLMGKSKKSAAAAAIRREYVAMANR